MKASQTKSFNPKFKIFSIRLPIQLYDDVVEAAWDNRIRKNAFITEALDAYVGIMKFKKDFDSSVYPTKTIR